MDAIISLTLPAGLCLSDIATDTLRSMMIGPAFAETFQVRPQREVEEAGDSLCSGCLHVDGGDAT